MKEKLAKLIDVKTIVTILLTVICGILWLSKGEIPDSLKTVELMVLTFYFSAQHDKTAKLD